MVCMEFGGHSELANADNNYHCNINTLFGDFEEYTMALDKVVRNIIVYYIMDNTAAASPPEVSCTNTERPCFPGKQGSLLKMDIWKPGLSFENG